MTPELATGLTTFDAHAAMHIDGARLVERNEVPCRQFPRAPKRAA